MLAPAEFHSYLQEICCRYEQWWTETALTKEIAAQQATFSFEQTVQTEKKDSAGKLKRITLPIFNAIENYIKSEHILLVGSPGIGKSTALLRYLVQLAEEEREKSEPRIPVLVPMKKYKVSFSSSEDPSGMLTLIRNALPTKIRRKLSISEVEELLFDKRLILLLDGLNEMSADAIRTYLKTFREECQDAQVPLICTTRELGGGDLGIKRRLEIQPLRSEEVERFLQDCIPDQKQKVLQLLNRDNRELSRTPFVLWMLYDLFQKQGIEVETLGGSFRQFFQSFKKYKEDAPVSDERRQEWNRWLEYLAFTMLNYSDLTDPGLVISKEQAEKSLIEKFGDLYGASSRIEELLKYHLLEPISEKEISFQHQPIQEYYAAECILTRLPDLLKKQPGQKYAPFQMNYLNYAKWTEAIALMFGLPEVNDSYAKHLVELALDTDLMLGARLAGEVQPEFQEQTVNSVDQAIHENNLPEWLRVELLGRTRSDIVLPEMLQALNNLNIEIARTAAAVIGYTNNQTAIDLLTSRLEEFDFRFFAQTSFGGPDRTGEIWTIHVEALSYVSPQQAVRFLRNKLDPINGSKHTILTMLTRASELLMKLDGEALFPELIEQLRDAESEHQKNHILNIISSANKHTFELFIPRLIQALEEEKIPSIQVRLIELIGESTSNLVTQTFVRLITQPKLRQKITKQLIQRDAQDFAQLEELLTHENLDVAYSAAFVLGHLGKTSALPTLSNIVRSHNLSTHSSSSFEGFIQAQNRVMASTALGLIDHEESILCLLHALNTDDNDYVRREAAFSLSKLGRQEAIPELLIALYADYIDARTHGIRGLAKLGVEEPLWNMLKTKATCWQTAAVELGKLGKTEVLSYLRQALADLGFESSNEVIHLLAKFADLETCNWLVNALDNPELHQADQYFCNRIAFVLIECRPEIVRSFLPALKEVIARSYVRQIFWLIPAIQSRCGFYNYEIAQFSQISPQGDETTEDLLSTINQTTQATYEKVNKMADTPKVEMNFHGSVGNAVGNVEGDMVINSAPSQEATTAISKLLNNLRQKHPNATDEEIYDILLQGFQAMPQKNPQNWQRWQDILSIFFSGGIEATKVLIPVAGIPIEVLKQLYGIYDRNRKQLPGS